MNRKCSNIMSILNYEFNREIIKEEPIGINPNFAFADEIIYVKEWLITILILCIPIVNIVMPFVWAFSKGVKKSKQNFFKAVLWFFVILIGTAVILGLCLYFVFSLILVKTGS